MLANPVLRHRRRTLQPPWMHAPPLPQTALGKDSGDCRPPARHMTHDASDACRGSRCTSIRTPPTIAPLRVAAAAALVVSDAPCSRIGVAVYRVGVGMYHSSLVVNDLEWHFWEGLGVEVLRRYFDAAQGDVVSIDHVPLVEYLPIDTLAISPKAVASVCLELGSTIFSMETYDLLRCNCNHFTAAVLQRLGLESKMPPWINRLASTADALCTAFPFVRSFLDVLLNRKGFAPPPRCSRSCGLAYEAAPLNVVYKTLEAHHNAHIGVPDSQGRTPRPSRRAKLSPLRSFADAAAAAAGAGTRRDVVAWGADAFPMFPERMAATATHEFVY